MKTNRTTGGWTVIDPEHPTNDSGLYITKSSFGGYIIGAIWDDGSAWKGVAFSREEFFQIAAEIIQFALRGGYFEGHAED